MKFKSDFRETNPKLHKMYVAWALHDLKIAQDAANELFDCSRFPASIIGGAIMEQVRQQVLSDAAWFEAAALLSVNADISEYEEALDPEIA
jgi:hypothetical protein